MGLLREHGERFDSLHAPLRGVLEDPPLPPSQKREARRAPLQEVGGGRAHGGVSGGGCCLHGE